MIATIQRTGVFRDGAGLGRPCAGRSLVKVARESSDSVTTRCYAEAAQPQAAGYHQDRGRRHRLT